MNTVLCASQSGAVTGERGGSSASPSRTIDEAWAMHCHRLLIVEDDHDTRISLGGIFSRMGWLVRLASTAAEGVEWIDEGHEPCCLILDLTLPDGGGECVLQLAREKGLRTYVAVCTGIT